MPSWKCRKCGKEKPLGDENFTRDNHHKTGWSRYCKTCSHVAQNESRRKAHQRESGEYECYMGPPTEFDEVCSQEQIKRSRQGISSQDKAI